MALIETVPRTVSGREFSFHFYVEIENRDAQLTLAVDNGLARIPQVHLELMDQNILVVERLAGGRTSGGGFYPPGDRTWYGRERNTGVPDADLDLYLPDDEHGIIAITKTAFERNIVYLSLTHEAAHSLDSRSSIYPSDAALADFAGIKYPQPRVGEYAAEAYSRYFAARGAICRGEEVCPHPDSHPRTCDEGIIATLMRSPAFQMLSSGDLRRGGSRAPAATTAATPESVPQAREARASSLSAAALDATSAAPSSPRGPRGCLDPLPDRLLRGWSWTGSWHRGRGASECE